MCGDLALAFGVALARVRFPPAGQGAAATSASPALRAAPADLPCPASPTSPVAMLADARGDSARLRQRDLARTVASATPPNSRRDRTHRRRRNCTAQRRQFAAERRALPTPQVSPLAQALADTTVRTCAEAAAAPGRSRRRRHAIAGCARDGHLHLVNPPDVPDFRVCRSYYARIAAHCARHAGHAGAGEPPP